MVLIRTTSGKRRGVASETLPKRDNHGWRGNMLTDVSGTDILRAYQILFSPAEQYVRHAFPFSLVRNLDPLAVKTAFRKKALETHPDRARVLGREEDEQADLFRQVQRAYEVLLPVVEKREAVERKVREAAQAPRRDRGFSSFSQKPQGTFGRKPPAYYYGAIPQQKLRLGHFLYYSGMISWQNLIGAVTYHMRSRPRYGEIALGWRMITPEELMAALGGRGQGERIGETLRRVELLSDFQHLAILGKQKKFHILFGQFFVNEGILSQRQLDIAVRRAIRHNGAVESMRFRFRR